MVTPRGIAMLMTSGTAVGENHGVGIAATDHTEGGESQSHERHFTDMRKPLDWPVAVRSP